MSLSIRIFIWFWLSVMLVAALTYAWARSDFWTQMPLAPTQEKFTERQVERIIYNWHKRPDLKWIKNRIIQTGGVIWWVYDQHESLFLSPKVPKQLELHVASKLSLSAESGLSLLGPNWIIGPVPLPVTEKSDRYVLYYSLPPDMTSSLHWEQLLRHSPFLAVGIIALLAAVSYLVAKQIANPLESLRKTSEQIANGDFKAEVEPKLLNRLDEIGSLSRTTSQMGQTIDAALSAHKRLLSDVSHELRTPLTRLSLANSIMTKRQGKSQENERIEHEVKVLNGMIEQLLSLSRMQLMPEQERKPVEVRPVIKNCFADAEYSYPDIHFKFIDEVDPQLSPWVKGSDELLNRAIQNLLNNASRYCESTIQLSLRNRSSHWIIKVEDDGTGVPDEELNKLFAPFYRPQVARERDKGGTGLGLAIVEQAIIHHGGQVKAEHSELGGLAVLMVLPKYKENKKRKVKAT